MLKRVSELSGVNLVCSTGFYYTDEPILYNTSAERLCGYMVADAHTVNAEIIKCAVENETVSCFEAEPKSHPQPRFSYCFDYVLSKLPKALSEKQMCQNPVRMLTCK